jgi:hypothetical protein
MVGYGAAARAEHPHEVGRILLPPNEYPRWLALEPGGDRLRSRAPARWQLEGFATIDLHTGRLTLEPSTNNFIVFRAAHGVGMSYVYICGSRLRPDARCPCSPYLVVK